MVMAVSGAGSGEERNQNAGGLPTTEAEAIIGQADLDGIAQRREADDLDLVAFEQAHFHQPLRQRVVALERFDAAALTGAELIEGEHGGAFGNWSFRARAPARVCP